MSNDKARAAAWARQVLAEPDKYVILDTETTGLDSSAEVVQVAVIDPRGEVLLDTLVRPVGTIPEAASRIHGITYKDVADAPGFADVLPQLQTACRGRTVIIYNADYDTRLLWQSAKAAGGQELCLDARAATGVCNCAMHWYAQWVGEIGQYGDYRWQRLPGGDHSALGDCRATLEVLKRMAGEGESS